MSTFGDRLAEAREDAGFTQQEMADALGAGQSAIAKYETNDRTPHPFVDFCLRAASLLKVNPVWLTMGWGDKKGNATMQGTLEYWQMLETLPEDDREVVFGLIRSLSRKGPPTTVEPTTRPRKRGKM